MAFNPARRDDSAFTYQHRRFMEEYFLNEDIDKLIYDHQYEALVAVKRQLVDEVEPRVERPNIALVVLPTGCGKTGVAVLAPYVLNSRRVLVLTPSKAISEQIHQAFRGCNEESMFLVQRGIIRRDQAQHMRPTATLIDNPNQIRGALHHDLLVITAHQVGGNASVSINNIRDDNFDLVIVDEAHHYPAETWRTIVDHFPNSRRLFLTATPYHRDEYILERVERDRAGLEGNEHIRIDACYTLNLRDAIDQGIIRDNEFDELGDPGDDEITAMEAVANRISERLDEHDRIDPDVRHQAMVLTQTVRDINSAENFCQAYNRVIRVNDPYQCEMYVGGTDAAVLQRFQDHITRTLVVVDKLREGYDNKRVSVVAIVRNVGQRSTVLFAQFVGRAIRKVRRDDPVTAVIIAHRRHNQRQNYEQFDRVNDQANDDDANDEANDD